MVAEPDWSTRFNVYVNNVDVPVQTATANRVLAEPERPEQDEEPFSKKATIKVALPDYFDGDAKNYKRFRRTYGTYIYVNGHLFREDYKKILFVLSYMRQGRAGRWADDFVERATTNEDWGTWEDFKDKMAHDFLDKNEARRAIEELDQLRQGKGTAADYFMELEQLAATAEINP